MNRYASAAAFKQAMESRLRSASSSGVNFARRRQRLVFDRFLARLTREFGDSAMLEGGLVVELRVERARTTKDIDLRIAGAPTELLERFQRAARLELGDFMAFTIALDVEHPEITNEGMRYEGQRYRVVCALAGKPYGQPFGLDIAFADPVFGEPDIAVAPDVLGFNGIAPPTLRLYPLETHIAEKLHAYTLPRKRPNSRVKDLPDIALLARVRDIAAERLRGALEQTFIARGTHELPVSLPPPPRAWAEPYARMAVEVPDIAEGWSMSAREVPDIRDRWSSSAREVPDILERRSGRVGDVGGIQGRSDASPRAAPPRGRRAVPRSADASIIGCGCRSQR